LFTSGKVSYLLQLSLIVLAALADAVTQLCLCELFDSCVFFCFSYIATTF